MAINFMITVICGLQAATITFFAADSTQSWWISHIVFATWNLFFHVLLKKTTKDRIAGTTLTLILFVWPTIVALLTGGWLRWAPLLPVITFFVVINVVSGYSVPINLLTRTFFHIGWDVPLLLNIFLVEYLFGKVWLSPGDGTQYESQLDPNVFLASLPTPARVAYLQHLGVRSVVNLCAEYPGPIEAYRACGIQQLHLPTLDGTAPTYEVISKACAFIEAQVKKDPSSKVLVHCKGGIGRSAAVCLSYLVKTYKKSMSQTFAMMKEKRTIVEPRVMGYNGVRRVCDEAGTVSK